MEFFTNHRLPKLIFLVRSGIPHFVFTPVLELIMVISSGWQERWILMEAPNYSPRPIQLSTSPTFTPWSFNHNETRLTMPTTKHPPLRLIPQSALSWPSISSKPNSSGIIKLRIRSFTHLNEGLDDNLGGGVPNGLDKACSAPVHPLLEASTTWQGSSSSTSC